MSYSIAVYSRATRAAYKQGVTVEDVYEFLEKEANLVLFTPEQIRVIQDHLEERKYYPYKKVKLLGSNVMAEQFIHAQEGLEVRANLTAKALYFSCDNGEASFEASMTASEFETSLKRSPLRGHFAVFDTENLKSWRK
jgi:hypothetical protein